MKCVHRVLVVLVCVTAAACAAGTTRAAGIETGFVATADGAAYLYTTDGLLSATVPIQLQYPGARGAARCCLRLRGSALGSTRRIDRASQRRVVRPSDIPLSAETDAGRTEGEPFHRSRRDRHARRDRRWGIRRDPFAYRNDAVRQRIPRGSLPGQRRQQSVRDRRRQAHVTALLRLRL